MKNSKEIEEVLISKGGYSIREQNNPKEMLELLISKGEDINAKDIIYLNIIIVFLINIIKNQ